MDPTAETALEEDFDTAFERVSVDEPVDAPVDEPADEPAEAEEIVDEPAEAEEIVAEPVEAEEIVAEPVEEVAADVKEEPAPAEKKKLTTAEGESSDDLLRRFAEIVQDTKPKKADADAPRVEKASEEPKSSFTAEEQEALDQYKKDWPDVSAAESLIRRDEYRQLVTHMFAEISKQLQPLAQTVQALAERTQLTDLRASVSDYDDVRDSVVEWVEEQPMYLQHAYKDVITQGTTEEVADLIQRFKADTGRLKTTEEVPEEIGQTETELPAEAKKAAASLAPVSSKRSAVPKKGEDRNDFDSAFDRFAKEVANS